MARNLKGGKYAKKQKNHRPDTGRAEQPHPVPGQQRALVLRMLGQCRVMLLQEDGMECMGLIRGAMRKRIYIRPGDLVLVSERETNEERADVVFKYDELYVTALRRTDPRMPFWKAAVTMHGAQDAEDEHDELVGFDQEAHADDSAQHGDDSAGDGLGGDGSDSGSDPGDLDIDAI